jgi:hypothetical protein
MTAYGRRKQDEQREAFSSTRLAHPATARAIAASVAPRWMFVSGIIAIGIVLLFILLHLTGSGFRH